MTKPHNFPESMPRQPGFVLTLDGQPVDVLATEHTAFASYECDGAHTLELVVPGDASKATVHPRRYAPGAEVAGDHLRIRLDGAAFLMIEVPGSPELFIYANPPAAATPVGENVIAFAGGAIHDAGEIQLESGQTLWIEPGAVVRGSVRASGAHKIRIGGYGVLDGSPWMKRGLKKRSVFLDNCRDSRIEGIVMIHPTMWMLTLGACEDTLVHGIKQIGECVSSDGVDVVGSVRTRVSGCCLRNGDDNIAVKALEFDASADASQVEANAPTRTTSRDVEDLTVEDCCFYNDRGGSSMEIGYETRCDRIRNILFRNIDVLAVHGHGAVFGIHTGDRAVIENVTWEDIRIEHHYDKLIDLRILRSHWNRDTERGQVRNVTIKDVTVWQSQFNEGYTINLIGGYDAEHPVSGVTIENVVVDGRRITSLDEIQLFTRHCHELRLV